MFQKPHQGAIQIDQSPFCLNATTRIVIVDRHPLYREVMERAIYAHLEKNYDHTEILQAAEFQELQLILSERSDVDLILLDLALSGSHNLLSLSSMRADYKNIPVMIVSANEEPGVIEDAYVLGISAYIPKTASVDTFLAALDCVLNGNIWRPVILTSVTKNQDEYAEICKRVASLSKHQSRVLSMIAEGHFNKNIADKLDVKESTIKAHITAIFRKLNVNTRTQAVVMLSKWGAKRMP